MTKRFRVCPEANKNVEDTKTGEAFLCYNEEVAKELAMYLNAEITGTDKEIFKMTAFDLIRTKDQLVIDYNDFMEEYREKEAKLYLETDFKELKLTNEKMRTAYINKEMATEKAVRQSYEHSIDIVNDLLKLRMKEVTKREVHHKQIQP